MYDVNAVRADFPGLHQKVHSKPLVYLDNAATTQIPAVVLDRVAECYRTANGNVYRGNHYLASKATENLENARQRVADFINAPGKNCIVFTRGTTEAINTVAGGLRRTIVAEDVIVTTRLEHHSNFVPWQQLCQSKEARFEVCNFDAEGNLDIDEFNRLLQLRPKVVTVTCCSNVLGTVTPIEKLCAAAHEAGALVLLDAAQAMRHKVIDVQKIGCDFMAFSGHKMMAGTGIGALYGKAEALEKLWPCEFGGEMVATVSTEESTFEELPLRLEAGTPNYMGSVALATAMNYLESLGREEIIKHEDALIEHALQGLSSIPYVKILGKPSQRAGSVSFTVESVDHHELCAYVDKMGIALRSGNNCARPAMEALGLAGVSRLSPAFYNTHEEIDMALEGIEQGVKALRNSNRR